MRPCASNPAGGMFLRFAGYLIETMESPAWAGRIGCLAFSCTAFAGLLLLDALRGMENCLGELGFTRSAGGEKGKCLAEELLTTEPAGKQRR